MYKYVLLVFTLALHGCVMLPDCKTMFHDSSNASKVTIIRPYNGFVNWGMTYEMATEECSLGQLVNGGHLVSYIPSGGHRLGNYYNPFLETMIEMEFFPGNEYFFYIENVHRAEFAFVQRLRIINRIEAEKMLAEPEKFRLEREENAVSEKEEDDLYDY